jgi:hypothetical protein
MRLGLDNAVELIGGPFDGMVVSWPRGVRDYRVKLAESLELAQYRWRDPTHAEFIGIVPLDSSPSSAV